jgi:cell wall-associated NlpC family hydrolase
LATRSLLSATVAVAAAALAGAQPVAAEPSVAEIENQIDTAWHKLEPIIEQHNLTRTQLASKKKAAAKLAKKIQPLELQVNIAMSRVGELAALQYKGGAVSAANSLVSGSSPTRLAERLQILDHFAKRQKSDIRNVMDLKAKYDAQKAPLDALIVGLTKAEKQLGTKAKQIDAEIDKLGKLRLQAYGSGGGGTGELKPVPCPTTYPGGDASAVIKFACAQIGKPYVWGASGPGSYDCSGLTQAAWAKAGVGLAHNAAAQRNQVKSVSRSNLRAGDLVFYYSGLSHVGMYAGKANGTDWIVHASQSGEPVQMRKMDDGNIHSYGRPS